MCSLRFRSRERAPAAQSQSGRRSRTIRSSSCGLTPMDIQPQKTPIVDMTKTSARSLHRTPTSTDVEGLPRGDRNENPTDIDLLALLAEDFRTHDNNVLEPGFWAVAKIGRAHV